VKQTKDKKKRGVKRGSSGVACVDSAGGWVRTPCRSPFRCQPRRGRNPGTGSPVPPPNPLRLQTRANPEPNPGPLNFVLHLQQEVEQLWVRKRLGNGEFLPPGTMPIPMPTRTPEESGSRHPVQCRMRWLRVVDPPVRCVSLSPGAPSPGAGCQARRVGRRWSVVTFAVADEVGRVRVRGLRERSWSRGRCWWRSLVG